MTSALTWARLSFRQQRWELILVAFGVAATAIGMLWLASHLDGMRTASPECLGLAPDPGFFSDSTPPACQAVLQTYFDTSNLGQTLLYLSFGAPFGIGVLLGAPLVAREIDGGTAQLAWSIGRSRTWWLLRRIAFITLSVALALGLLAVTSEILAAALAPERTLSEDFIWFGRRGWLIVARGIGALMLGMLVGAVIGRVLPAILAAVLVMALAFTGLSFAQDRWQEGIAETLPSVRTTGVMDDGALTIGSGLRLADGEIVSWEELGNRGVDAMYLDEAGRMYASEQDMRDGDALGTEVVFAIPGSQYAQVAAVVGAGSLALGLVALGLTTLVVRRRRPV